MSIEIDPLSRYQVDLEKNASADDCYVVELEKAEFLGWSCEIRALWMDVRSLTPGRVNRLSLGEKFRALRELYSERSRYLDPDSHAFAFSHSGGNRRTSAIRRLTPGHGTFEKECQRRGYNPRTVRDLIADYEAFQSGRPSAAEKRKARTAKRKPASLRQAISNIVDLAKASTPDELEKCEAFARELLTIILRAKKPHAHTSTNLVAQIMVGGIQ